MSLFFQGAFQVDPKRDTPESIAQKRQMVRQMMMGNRAPKDVGEGLNAIGQAIIARTMMGEAQQAEAAGTASAAADFNPLLDEWRSRMGLDAGGFPAAPNPGDSTSMATMPAPDTASARVAQAHGDSTAPAGNLTESKQAFINALMPAAMQESQRTGIDPRIIVAQAAQETGWGRSAPGNNYFGIKSHGKGGGQTFTTHEVINGKRVKIRDSFRQFASPADSVRGYGDFILQNPRYKAFMAAQGLDAQLAALQASGYATDPNYSRSVGAIARSIPLDMPAPVPQVASGLTPEALQSWAFSAYAPTQASNALDAVNSLGTAAPVGVAETEADILAQEAAMAGQDPQAFQQPQGLPQPQAFAQQPAPPLPAPQNVQDMPVAGIPQQPVQMAQAGGFPEMAGNNPRAIPAPGIDMQAIAKVLTNPFSNKEQRAFAQMLLEQEMQSRDPMRQMQLEKVRLELDAMRNPVLKPTDTQRNLEWRAQQAGLQPGTPEYADFMARGGQLPQQTTVNNVIGGEQLTPGQKKIDESFADTYLQWMGGGWADSAKQIEQLTESLDIIERAAKDGSNISGAIGALPSSVQPFVNPQGTIAREGVEEVVQRSLREILGAQFTEKEGERLIARAYNPMLPAAENAKRVRRLLGQVQGMAQSRQEMVDYFDENGTLRGFKGKRPNASQVDALVAEWAREDSRAGREMEPEVPDGVDPSDWEFMTPDERRLWQQ